jgi:CDP-6-deoxy-D-xylo-4-hexulose-3-dehydrase
MFEEMKETEAREQILQAVSQYCDKFHNVKKYSPGDRIPYASRIYDHNEMVSLVDSALDFWLTAGRYTEQFEKSFSQYLGVKYCSLVN